LLLEQQAARNRCAKISNPGQLNVWDSRLESLARTVLQGVLHGQRFSDSFFFFFFFDQHFGAACPPPHGARSHHPG